MHQEYLIQKYFFLEKFHKLINQIYQKLLLSNMKIVLYVKNGWVISIYWIFLARIFILFRYPLHDSSDSLK